MKQPRQRDKTRPQQQGRRRFLLTSLLGLLANSALYGCSGPKRTRDVASEAGWLLDVTGNHDAVRRLGQAYLLAHPEERDLEFLVTTIEAAIATEGDRESTAKPLGRAFAALERSVRNDYRHAAVTWVNGWLLSRTEGRLYAAVALLSTDA